MRQLGLPRIMTCAALLLGLPASQAVAQRPMDEWWYSRDANRFPKNPLWGQQVTSPGSIPDARWCFSLSGSFWNPLCSVQNPSTDTGWGVTDLICSIGSTTPIAGHVNWYPSTVTGPVYWSGQSTVDRDYNINIVPPNKNGLTSTSGSTIHSEADARETTNYFTVPWWVSFRDASDATKNVMINGKQAIIGALMGIDCEHDCQAELHPVWFIAIHIKDDPLDDQWAIYMRNWGNEGFCSQYCHHMLFDYNRTTVSIPWRPGATGVSLGGNTIFRTNNSGIYGWWSSSPYSKVDLTFQLPAPGDHGRVHGVLALRWYGTSVVAKADPVAPTKAPMALNEEAFSEEEEGEMRPGSQAERLVGELIEKMSPAQRAAFDHETHARVAPAQRDGRAMGLTRVRPTAASAAAATPMSSARVQRVREAARLAADKKVIEALQKAYGGRIPGVVGEKIEEFEQLQREKLEGSEE